MILEIPSLTHRRAFGLRSSVSSEAITRVLRFTFLRVPNGHYRPEADLLSLLKMFKDKSKVSSWLVYRQRNWVAMGLLILGLPATMVTTVALKFIFGFANELIFVSAVVLWCIAWGWAAFRVSRWPCPRCGKAWLANQEACIGAPRQCAACKLGLYQEP